MGLRVVRVHRQNGKLGFVVGGLSESEFEAVETRLAGLFRFRSPNR